MQKNSWRADLFVGGLDILSGCQTISKGECLAADLWDIRGQDGAEGFDPQDRPAGAVRSREQAGQ